MDKNYYILYLVLDDGSVKELARAKDTPFWVLIWTLAEQTYGEANITFEYII